MQLPQHLTLLNLFASFTFSTTPNASPDNFTISCVLKALASSFCSPELAKEVHCLILRRGLYSDIFVLNALITCYCRCDEVWLARHVFDGMSERDIVTWNAMIGGYSQRRLYDECKRLYLECNVAADAGNGGGGAEHRGVRFFAILGLFLSEWCWIERTELLRVV